MSAGGRASVIVRPSPWVPDDPAWSPGGEVLAYRYAFDDGSADPVTEVHLVDMDGRTRSHPVITGVDNDLAGPAFWPVSATGSAVLALDVSARPNRGYVGGPGIRVTFTAHNPNPDSATYLVLRVEAPDRSPRDIPLGTLAAMADAGTTVTFPTRAALTGTVRGVLSGLSVRLEPLISSVETTIAITQPTITANPAIGRPGTVSMVTGAGFPPGAVVRVGWTRGPPASVTVTVGPGGTFHTQVLVMRGDSSGPREATASGPAFATVTCPFLVLPGTQQPWDFVERR
jgi:hypothetical protein